MVMPGEEGLQGHEEDVFLDRLPPRSSRTLKLSAGATWTAWGPNWRFCKQHTAPRASYTCHTRNFSRRVHVAQDDRGTVLNAVRVSISSLFHHTLLDPQLSSWFVCSSLCPCTSTLQGGCASGPLATKLDGYLRKSTCSRRTIPSIFENTRNLAASSYGVRPR